jgi:hypothetical protein
MICMQNQLENFEVYTACSNSKLKYEIGTCNYFCAASRCFSVVNLQHVEIYRTWEMVKLWVLCTWVVSPLALRKMKVCSLFFFFFKPKCEFVYGRWIRSCSSWRPQKRSSFKPQNLVWRVVAWSNICNFRIHWIANEGCEANIMAMYCYISLMGPEQAIKIFSCSSVVSFNNC